MHAAAEPNSKLRAVAVPGGEEAPRPAVRRPRRRRPDARHLVLPRAALQQLARLVQLVDKGVDVPDCDLELGRELLAGGAGMEAGAVECRW
jgi:hypothetical protein